MWVMKCENVPSSAWRATFRLEMGNPSKWTPDPPRRRAKRWIQREFYQEFAKLLCSTVPEKYYRNRFRLLVDVSPFIGSISRVTNRRPQPEHFLTRRTCRPRFRPRGRASLTEVAAPQIRQGKPAFFSAWPPCSIFSVGLVMAWPPSVPVKA